MHQMMHILTERNDMTAQTKNFDSLPDSAILRPSAICELLSLSRTTIFRMVKAKKLNPIQLGERAVGYKVGEIREFLAGGLK